MKKRALPACAVLLAGGRGTRFWPRSRMRTPKQILNIVGTKTMLGETADRLAPLVAQRDIWVVTNVEQSAAVRSQLPKAPAAQIIAEPIGRNTAAAIGLAAVHLTHKHGDALMAVLPSDAHVQDAVGYRKLVRAALEQAREPGRMIVLGIEPTRPETGYGYIESGAAAGWPNGTPAYEVCRFTEKPELDVAKKYVASGKYFWNAGMFFWRASTFLDSLKKFLPATHEALSELAPTIGTKRYASVLTRIYPQLENISVDYAIMERAARANGQRDVFMVRANIGWSDVGSWAAVYELLAARPGANVSASDAFTLDADGNYFWAPKKFVAAIGVSNLVVVETDNAILICPRDRSQDVGKIVKFLEEQKRRDLL
jgi:mannose-1-phosphate guanylyltransferase